MSTAHRATPLTTVATRTILGSLEISGGRGDQVAQRLGDAIRRGMLIDGQRLPPEPELADQLGVATVTLREALAMLRQQGLVTTRRGRGGGTFVRRRGLEASASLGDFTVLDLRELGDHRRAIAGTAAALAADRALDDEIDGLRRQLARLRAALTPRERGAVDGQLAIAVAAAAQSARLTREEMRLRAELGELLWADLYDEEHAAVVRRRAALVEAIAGRRAARARNLAEAQVDDETLRLVTARLWSDDTARLRRDDTARLRRDDTSRLRREGTP